MDKIRDFISKSVRIRKQGGTADHIRPSQSFLCGGFFTW